MNKLNQISTFIKAWDNGIVQEIDITKIVHTSILGNINLKGDYHSDQSALLTKNDAGFLSVIEEGVRSLVSLIIHTFNWITYSSCQGHASYNGISYKKRVVQILPRNSLEKNIILKTLNIIRDRTNSYLIEQSENNINTLILLESLDSEGESECYECIKILFDNNGLEEEKYFQLIDKATTVFTKFLANHQSFEQQL
jgi:hypothetical protein